MLRPIHARLGLLFALLLCAPSPVAPEPSARFSELRAPVRVVVDHWGTPHLSAESLDDLYFAWGYVTASDRMWELEMTRRAGQGRMSEWFGNASLVADGGAQLFEFRQHAAQAWEDQRRDPAVARAFERYAAGINAYLARCRSGAVPWRAEFRAIGHTPEDWKPEDSMLELLGFGVLLDLDLPELNEAKAITEHGREWLEHRRRFEAEGQYDTVPDSAARRLYGQADRPRAGSRSLQRAASRCSDPSPDSPAVPLSLLAEARANLAGLLPLADPEGATRASNVFAVGAGRSASGAPLLANDPHLALGAPGPLHFIHVTVPGLVDAVGAAPVGLPVIVSGRNARCAWGITALSADVVDVYADTLSSDGKRVRWQGGWTPLRTAGFDLRFRVLGIPLPALGQVRRYSPHGPVVAFDRARHLALSVRWTALESTGVVSRLLGLERSSSADEVCARYRTLVTPGLNVVAADRDGAVRYQAVGLVPRRVFAPHLGPLPDDGRHEWSGFVPADHLPAWSPPRDGFVVNANNRPVGPPYPEALPRFDWFHDRARRIAMRLAGDRRVTLADLASVQNDVHSLAADRLLPRLLACADSLAATPAERAALDTLRHWDHAARRDRVGATLFRAWVGAINRRSKLDGTQGLLAAALDGRAPEALADSAGHVERAAVAALRGLDLALDTLSARLGPRLAGWNYGRAHQAVFRHRLADRDVTWQPPPLPADGDNSTPCVGPSALPWRTTFTHGPVFRHVVDLSRTDVSFAVLPPGNVGARNNPHSRDMLNRWARHGYVPLYLSWTGVERVKETEFKLRP
jgi:penicillin G amidase